MKYTKYYLLSLGVILLDQVVKLTIHYTMDLHQEIPVLGDWFKLHYTTNPGMAFGLEIGGIYGKLFLTSFRLLAMVGIAYYLYHLAKKGAKAGLLWCIALILAGAIGNLIDSIFYGVALGIEAPQAPTPWLHGQVIDMFYFDIWEGFLPHWIPVIGGQYYSLWPIFNIADASIFIGVAIILIMQKRYFNEGKPAKDNSTTHEKVSE